jgi:hypothetical protein
MNKSCNFCGLSGLHWETVNNKWKLYDINGNPHVCKSKKPAPNKLDITNDPLINKALNKFKKELRGNGKIYVIKKV